MTLAAAIQRISNKLATRISKSRAILLEEKTSQNVPELTFYVKTAAKVAEAVQLHFLT